MTICSCLIIRVVFKSNKRLSSSRPNVPIIENKTQIAEQEIIELNKLNNPNVYLSKVNNLAQTSPSLFSKVVFNKDIRKKSSNQLSYTQLSYLKKNKTKNLTYLLITINLLFFFLLGPLPIVMIFIKTLDEINKNKIWINIAYLMAYSNHAFNFVFYGLTSAPYRNTVLKLFNINITNKQIIRINQQARQTSIIKNRHKARKQSENFM